MHKHQSPPTEDRRRDHRRSAEPSPQARAPARTAPRSRSGVATGYLLLAGKALGVAFLLTAIFEVSEHHRANGYAEEAAAPVLKGNDIVNPINTVWTLVAAFLVFGMQAGFTMLEAGFCRSRETVNVLMECVVDTCLCGLLFYAWGFAFMFGSGTPFFGTEFFFLQGAPATYGIDAAWRSSPSGSSSTPSPTPARRSRRAR